MANMALNTDQDLRDKRDKVSYAWLLTEDQAIEILIRMVLRQDFKRLLDGKLDASLLDDLEKTFFEIIYPTPPER